ncbi:MAG: hypothetical protein AAF658_03530, partial [Myxococcota bacterium]
MSETHDTHSSESSRWQHFAAFVTWFGVLSLALLVATRSRTLPEWQRILGGGAACFTVVFGLLHLKLKVAKRTPRRRWISIGVQTLTALSSIYFLGEETLAVFLIIIASVAAESNERRPTLLWLAVTNLLLVAVLLALFSPLHVLISGPLFLGFQLFAVAMYNAVGSERRLREQLAGV